MGDIALTQKYLKRLKRLYIAFGIVFYVIFAILGTLLTLQGVYPNWIDWCIVILGPLGYILIGFVVHIKKRYIWFISFIISILSLLLIPIGTILAIFLIYYTLKKDVREYYFSEIEVE